MANTDTDIMDDLSLILTRTDDLFTTSLTLCPFVLPMESGRDELGC